MAEGTIKGLPKSGNFGFIKPDDGGKDVYFKFSWLKETTPQEGLRVQYEIEEGDRGPRARDLRVLASASATKNITKIASEYRFLNPYNFVRYLEKPAQEPTIDTPEKLLLWRCPPPPHDRYVGLTGRITCKVKAVTSLFISDSHAIKGKIGEHRTYRFFQYDDQPALPASSLRGMVRSIFEAVTNSCFAIFQEDKPYPLEYRRSQSSDMIPVRVVELDEENACLELLNLRLNNSRPLVARSGAVIGSYPPRVLNQRTGQTFKPDKSKLPIGACDGMRVAALVTKEPVLHRSKPYRAFQAECIVPVGQHQLLIEDNRLAKVFGWLHLTGPNIENKHDERLFFRWDDKIEGIPKRDDIPHRYLCECSSDIIKEYNYHLSEYWARLHRDVEELGDRRSPNGKERVPHPSTFVEKGRQLRLGDLVYAQRDEKGNILMLRPVSMPRIRYKYSRQCLLLDHLKKCKDGKKLCPACRVFGWVLDNPPKYVFSWTKIPGTDDNRLKEFLGKKYHIDWVYTAGIAKSEDGKTIRISKEDTTLSLTLNDEDSEVILKIDNIETDKFIAKEENGELNIYPPKSAERVAYAGRVRFSHGKIDGTWQTMEEIGLAILSTPKPTTTAFYLLNSDGQPDASVTYDTEGARLRGRKFFRHHPNPAEYKSSDPSDQNRTVRGALQPGTRFTFTIDFENLAPLELGALLYALELEDGMFHRLGYAKPLGFGSVKVTVENVKIIDWKTRLQSMDSSAGWQTIEWSHYKKAFLDGMKNLYSDNFEKVVLSDLRALLGTTSSLPIHYPRPGERFNPDHPQYEWFMGNKRRKANAESLNLAEKDTDGLPLIEKDGKDGRG